MKKIGLGFSDIHPRCVQFFKWFLEQRYDVVLDQTTPDFLIFSDFGWDFQTFPNAKRIYFTGENLRPNFNECHFALTFDRIDDPRHYRLPLYVVEYQSRWKEYQCIDSWEAIVRPKPSPEETLKKKTKFCNFIVSNPNTPLRDSFFKMLNEYKRVDSAGSHLNNMNWTLPKEPEKFFGSKLAFQSEYKFSIAFENSSYPGYTTEKIMDPMLVFSLPIYWGDPTVHQDFNPRSFINANAFKTLEELVNWVVKVDQNVELYAKYYEQPYLHENKLSPVLELENLYRFFDEKIFA